MKERLITSIVLIAVLLIIGFIDSRFLTGLVFIALSVAGYLEAARLFNIKNDTLFYTVVFASVAALFVNPFTAAVFAVVAAGSYIAYYQKDMDIMSVLFYPFLPLMMIYALYVKHGMGVLGWLIVIVALTDSFAYLTGKNFAKKFFNKGFCPTSPNKSWEGVIGGVVSGSVLGAFAGMSFTGFWHALAISLIVSVSSVFGDLFESFLKRRAGVKDSGNILPGHGGVLDRIDGYLFAGPVLFVLLGV